MKVDAGDRPYRGAAFTKRIPVFGHVEAERRDDSHACDGDAAWRHVRSAPMFRSEKREMRSSRWAASGGRRSGANRGVRRRSGDDFLDAFDDVADRANRADVVVRDRDFERVLEFEEKGKNIEGIDTQILEVRFEGDFVRGNSLHRRQGRD